MCFWRRIARKRFEPGLTIVATSQRVADARPITGSVKQSMALFSFVFARLAAFAKASARHHRRAAAKPLDRRSPPSDEGGWRRRDRAIEYSRDLIDRAEKPRRTGSPAFAGDDAENVARSFRVIASHPVGAKRRRMTGSAKQSIEPRKRMNGLLRRKGSSQ